MTDWSSKTGAEKIARKVERHWASKGVEVNAWVEASSPSNTKPENVLWVVRSDLKLVEERYANARYP